MIGNNKLFESRTIGINMKRILILYEEIVVPVALYGDAETAWE